VTSQQQVSTLCDRFRAVRRATRELVEDLTPEDCQIQSMPDVSPTKWHLAHTTWFFETFLLRDLPGYTPFHPRYEVLFNSYYNTVGEQWSRPQRGLLSRPGLEEVLAYRDAVESRLVDALESGALDSREGVVEVGLHHEQQHQELLLMDIQHVFAINPLRPAFRDVLRRPAVETPLRWHDFDRDLISIGHRGEGFGFDNEYPRHEVLSLPFRLASRLVTNAEFLAFLEDDGYTRPELWLADGWDTVQEEGWTHPFYWERDADGWSEMTLGGLRRLDPHGPVVHLSYYEADAYARWAGARLPTEQEWERAVARATGPDNFVEDGFLHPVGLEADADGLHQMRGDVWEWTRSPYAPYPGYRANEGALGEYNGKFMNNQYVQRGGACVTPRNHIRDTYRNFFPPQARWMFAGLRLARDPQ